MRIAAVVVLVGCATRPSGPGPEPTPTPAPVAPPKDDRIAELQAELLRCQHAHADGKKLIVMLQEENAKLVREGRPAANPVIDDKAAAKAAQQYVDAVKKATPAIAKCYKDAVAKKKVPKATVTVTMTATFSSSGQLDGLAFAPSLGDPFESCTRAVASGWTLATTTTITLKAPLTLTP